MSNVERQVLNEIKEQVMLREAAEARADELANLLRRIRQWDHLDSAADGPYWKREIDAALAENK